MRYLQRHSGVVLAAAVAILGIYVAAWWSLPSASIGRSDFTSTYAGASLLRDGHRSDLYDEGLQAARHAQLIAPDTEGNLPFVNPPSAALLALPFSRLPLDVAYRLWSVLQVGFLAAAVWLVQDSVEWASVTARSSRLTGSAIALAAVPTLSLLLLGQWDGLIALGLAGAYRAMRHHHLGWAGTLLAVSVAVAKPHLGLGLAAFVLGWRRRQLIAGAIGGGIAMAAVNLATVGPIGCAAFLHAILTSATRWHLRSLLGFTGFFGAWLGDGPAAQSLAGFGTLAAMAVAFMLGQRMRRSPDVLEVALGGAIALSLVAAPHLLGQDLVLLVPAAVWTFGWASRTPSLPKAVGGWLAFNLAAVLDLGNDRPAPPGRLVPLALVGLASWAVAITSPTNSSQ